MLPRPEAEEAVQEALARAWRRRDACRTLDQPLPWVLEITRNEARRLYGQRAIRLRREQSEEVPLERQAEDAQLAGVALRVSLERALHSLDEVDRSVVRLRYHQDLTQLEVAQRLGMPEGTVKVRLHRARRTLRTLLEGET